MIFLLLALLVNSPTANADVGMRDSVRCIFETRPWTGLADNVVIPLPSKGQGSKTEDTAHFSRKVRVQGPSGVVEVPFEGSFTLRSDGEQRNLLISDFRIGNPFLNVTDYRSNSTRFYIEETIFRDRAGKEIGFMIQCNAE